jgi:hypothetical protein
MPVILPTQEERSGGSWFEASLGKQFHETLPRKNPSQKRAGGVIQGVGPELKSQYFNFLQQPWLYTTPW